MSWIELTALAPEIFIACMACIILMVDVFFSKYGHEYSYALSLLTLFTASFLSYSMWSGLGNTPLNGFVADGFVQMLKIMMYFVLAIILIYSRDYLKTMNLYRGEYFVLMLFSLVGMMLLIASNHFLILYLGLELFALPTYALVAMSDKRVAASEAAMKYFVMGAMASALLLYGISLIYGVTGTFEFDRLAEYSAGQNIMFQFGLILVIASIIFKLGGAPFHMWVPDVYQGAPVSVGLFIGTIAKLAAFGMAYRILDNVFAANVNTAIWQVSLMLVASLSLVLGNCVAIAQTNLKRMLAYSTIAHMGFVMLGLIAGPVMGYDAALFYVFTYVLMALAAFGIIILCSRTGVEAEEIADFKGLGEQHPGIALMMMVVMFSMAGIPPTVGFYAKFAVLQAVFSVEGMQWLALVALLSSVVGAFYYLRVIKTMFFDSPGEQHELIPQTAGMGFVARIILRVNALALVVFGLAPAYLIALCRAAFEI